MANPLEDAVAAAAAILKGAWPVIARDMAGAIQRSQVRVVSIETLFLKGEISQESRDVLLGIEKKTIVSVAMSFEIVAIETAQAAANAAVETLLKGVTGIVGLGV